MSFYEITRIVECIYNFHLGNLLFVFFQINYFQKRGCLGLVSCKSSVLVWISFCLFLLVTVTYDCIFTISASSLWLPFSQVHIAFWKFFQYAFALIKVNFRGGSLVVGREELLVYRKH